MANDPNEGKINPETGKPYTIAELKAKRRKDEAELSEAAGLDKPAEPGKLPGATININVGNLGQVSPVKKSQLTDKVVKNYHSDLFPKLNTGNRESNVIGARIKKSGDWKLNDAYDPWYDEFMKMDDKQKPAAFTTFLKQNIGAIAKLFPEYGKPQKVDPWADIPLNEDAVE